MILGPPTLREILRIDIFQWGPTRSWTMKFDSYPFNHLISLLAFPKIS